MAHHPPSSLRRALRARGLPCSADGCCSHRFRRRLPRDARDRRTAVDRRARSPTPTVVISKRRASALPVLADATPTERSREFVAATSRPMPASIDGDRGRTATEDPPSRVEESRGRPPVAAALQQLATLPDQSRPVAGGPLGCAVRARTAGLARPAMESTGAVGRSRPAGTGPRPPGRPMSISLRSLVTGRCHGAIPRCWR